MPRLLKQKPCAQQEVDAPHPDPLIQEARQAVQDLSREGVHVEEAWMVRLLQSVRALNASIAAGHSPGLDLTDLGDDDFMNAHAGRASELTSRSGSSRHRVRTDRDIFHSSRSTSNSETTKDSRDALR